MYYQDRNPGWRDDHGYEMQQIQTNTRNIHGHPYNDRYDNNRLSVSEKGLSSHLMDQNFENKLPNYEGIRNLAFEMDRQNDYRRKEAYHEIDQNQARQRPYDQNNAFERGSNSDFHRDSRHLVRHEFKKRSSFYKDEADNGREKHGERKSTRDYNALSDDIDNGDNEEAETGFDEPVPDYGEGEGRIHHEVRQREIYDRDVSGFTDMHRNQRETDKKGRDNPAFTYDDWALRRYEQERKSQDQNDMMTPETFRNQWERYDKYEHERTDVERNENEKFISGREISQSLLSRRGIRHRATIASPRDIHITPHEAFNTLQRSRSERRRKSVIIDERNNMFQEKDNDENKLPSNRHAWRKPLNERIEALHDDRDQILPKTQKKLGLLDIWKYQLAMKWLQLKNGVKSWVYQLELWAGHLKIIEGHFGTSTMTYFRFLRWLMFLNLLITIIMMGVILTPFLALKPTVNSDFVSFVNACQSEHHFLASYFSQNYTDTINATGKRESLSQRVLDVLQGTGWLEHTELFYGSYFNRTISVPQFGEHVYNMDLAYLFAVAAVFLLNFVLLVKNSAKGIKEGILTSGGTMTRYCNKVFGAWDFCITSKKTADIRSKNILQGLQSELEFQRLQWRKAGRTTMEKVKLYFARFIINILVLMILSGSLYLIYFCFTDDELLRLQQDTSLSEVVLLVLQYVPSLAITVLNVIVPVIFSKLVIAEDYMPAFGLRLTLLRTVLLRLASLGVLMGSLYDKLTSTRPRHVDINNTICDNLQPYFNTTEPDQMCWETYVGQQLYKLLILNFLLAVVMTILVKFPRKLVYSKLKGMYKLVAMVGAQRLSLFFCPLTPAMCCLMCFVFFYVQKATLLYTCEPIQQYGTTKSNSLFMTTLLLSFGLSAAPIIFMIGSISPSRSCGPFRVYSSQDYVMFDSITYLVDTFPTEVKDALYFLSKGASMFVIGLILCFSMYYFWAVGQAHHKMTKLLRDQLKQEGHDKQFLLARVNEVLNQDNISGRTADE